MVYKLFDSKVHGDPATFVLTAYTKERVIIRYLMPGDKPRNIGFLIHGHEWLEQPDNPLSNVEAVKGAISVGNVYNLELLGGASDCPGDYLYRSGSLRWDVESGMWGISGSQCVRFSTTVLPAAGMRASGGKRFGRKRSNRYGRSAGEPCRRFLDW